MKVIFLDNDGVICLANNWGGRFKKQEKWGGRKMSMRPDEMPVDVRFDNFDKKAIQVLNSILEETGAEIVVSSDWKRWANVDELGDYYTSQGIIKRPIDATMLFKDMLNNELITLGDEFPGRNWMLEFERAHEIKYWLSQHPEVTHWVAVDDLRMGKTGKDWSVGYTHDWGLDNFVETPRSREGIKQSGIKEEILKFLI